MSEHGYSLARGTRRGFVAVSWQGEIISLSRWLGVKKRDISARLGSEKDLPSIEQAKATMDKTLMQKMQSFDREIRQTYAPRQKALMAAKEKMAERHQKQRATLIQKQREHYQRDEKMRNARHAQGLRGLWQRVTGEHKLIQRQNQMDMYHAHQRDLSERDAVIFQQIKERKNLQVRIDNVSASMYEDLQNMHKSLCNGCSPEKLVAAKLEVEYSFQNEQTLNL